MSMLLARNIRSNIFSDCIRSTALRCCQQCSTASASVATKQPTEPLLTDTVTIPKRKKRDSLSILRALAGTVQRDPNQPQYSYIDDPHLLPTSQSDKRAFLYARASGRKAADYVIEKYPEVFTLDPAIPSIKPFNIHHHTHQLDTLDGLAERIDGKHVTEAVNSYQQVKEKGIDVPQSTQEALLDLLCYYNSQDKLEARRYDEPVNEDKTYSPLHTRRDSYVKDGAAEQLFQEITDKNSRVYNAIITAKAMYASHEDAMQLFGEAREHNMQVNEFTYNKLIQSVCNSKQRIDDKHNAMKELLRKMQQDGVQPTINTFNAALAVMETCALRRYTRQWTMEILNEIKHLNLEPTLTTWYRVLRVFYHKGAKSNILLSIMKEIKNKEFVYTEPTDTRFFHHAMRLAQVDLQDVQLAYDINTLLNTGNNYMLIGDGERQGVYYSSYLQCVCVFESMDKIMEVLRSITPHAFTPGFSAMTHLLEAVELNEGYQYIPEIWSNAVLFGYAKKPDIVETIFRLMTLTKDTKLRSTFMDVLESYDETLDFIITRLEEHIEEQKVTRLHSITGKMFGYMVEVAVAAGHIEKAKKYMDMYYKHMNIIEGYPSETSLSRLMENSIDEKNVDAITKYMVLMSHCSYPKVDKYLNIIKERLQLDQETLKRLEYLA